MAFHIKQVVLNGFRNRIFDVTRKKLDSGLKLSIKKFPKLVIFKNTALIYYGLKSSQHTRTARTHTHTIIAKHFSCVLVVVS